MAFLAEEGDGEVVDGAGEVIGDGLEERTERILEGVHRGWSIGCLCKVLL